mmetsp:Transcript_27810/g.50251  ORF Transcript_27810/g.50251 Transcript_27810/m.50251 type:complete len:527 (-) Transcript_27810:69-1649(-)
MKTAKRSNKGKGGNEPSVLDYFSKSKRKKVSKSQQTTPSFGTPATPVAHHLADDINESETPVSVVSDDAVLSEPHSSKLNPVRGRKHARRRNDAGREQGTPDSSTTIMSSATPDKHEPNTPPYSPAPGSCVPHQPNGSLGERESSSTKRAHPSETPPSNDTYMTTPPSPPTPTDTWRDCPIDQKENESNNKKRNQTCSYEGSSEIQEYVGTPKSLLGTKETPPQNDVNMGTPSTACTPSTSTPSSAPPSNGFFRNYAASTSMSSTKSSKTRKMDQHTIFSKQNTKPTKKQNQSNQLFLDFGQNSFGRQTICNICGMLRVHGMEEDDAQHAKICKEYKEGVTCLGWKNERRIATFEKGDKILEVRPDDAQQHRNKVLEVKTIVDKELGFASRNNEDPSIAVANMTFYIYISKKRVVGLLMVKRIQRAYELLSSKEGDDNSNSNDNSSSISRSLKPSKALLGIHQIWVHNSHRSRGIASKLVTAARDHLIFGMMVPLELVAFSSPTDEGLRFAKSYIGSERPLIYDIH